MKKLILIVSVAIFALASCKKDRTCTCKNTLNGTTIESKYIIEGSKSKAKAICEGKGVTIKDKDGKEKKDDGGTCTLD